MSGRTYHGCSSPWKDKTQGPCACSSPITSSLFCDFRRLSLRFPGTHVGYCLLTSSQGSLEADLISLAAWPLLALWIPLCPILDLSPLTGTYAAGNALVSCADLSACLCLGDSSLVIPVAPPSSSSHVPLSITLKLHACPL